MKKIFFITPTDIIGASSRYRVYQYLPYIKDEFDYEIYPFMSNDDYERFKNGKKALLIFRVPLLYLKRIKFLFICHKNDVLFIHRDICPFGPMIMEKLLKLKGCKLIIDLDDAVYCSETAEISNKGNKFLYKLKYGKRFDIAIRNANTVICGNKYIKEHSLPLNNNCVIVPTVIDTKMIKCTKKWNDLEEEITIGWIGNPGNTDYVLNILDDINRYFKNSEIKCNLVLIGASDDFDSAKYENLNIIIKKWSLETEYKDLSMSDFGIMPLRDSNWSKGKCGAKILQYFAAGIPALASGVGVNSDIVEDDINGFVVKDNKWYDGIDHMVKNRSKWKQWGKNGRAKVEKEYSIISNIDIIKKELRDDK